MSLYFLKKSIFSLHLHCLTFFSGEEVVEGSQSLHSPRCGIASHWSFDLHFANDLNAQCRFMCLWLCIHRLWGNACLSHLLILKLDYFIIEL